jgi:CHASE2 domain-containing sensor protein
MQISMVARSHPRLSYKDQMTATRAEHADLYTRVPIAQPLVQLAGYYVDTPGPDDLINFYGPSRAIPRVSLYKLIGARAAEAMPLLHVKVVVMGIMSVSRGLGQIDKDAYPVPSSKYFMAGTEIHANVVGNLIDKSWLRRLSASAESSVIIYAALFIALIGIALPLEKGAPLALGILAIATYLDYHAFASMNRWFPGLPLVAVIGIIALLIGAVRHNIGIRRFRAYIKRTFGFEMERKA